jgi:translation initiation factor IF-3
MDYGRYKYERKKKLGKSKGHTTTLKEVKLRPRTDQHDLDFKLKNARRFLLDGDKVKVTLMYRGREMVHRSLGYKQLDLVKTLLVDVANVENPPRMEGRFLSMILVPNREAIAETARAEKTAAKAAAKKEAEGKKTPDEAVDAEQAATPEAVEYEAVDASEDVKAEETAPIEAETEEKTPTEA